MQYFLHCVDAGCYLQAPQLPAATRMIIGIYGMDAIVTAPSATFASGLRSLRRFFSPSEGISSIHTLCTLLSLDEFSSGEKSDAGS